MLRDTIVKRITELEKENQEIPFGSMEMMANDAIVNELKQILRSETWTHKPLACNLCGAYINFTHEYWFCPNTDCANNPPDDVEKAFTSFMVAGRGKFMVVGSGNDNAKIHDDEFEYFVDVFTPEQIDKLIKLAIEHKVLPQLHSYQFTKVSTKQVCKLKAQSLLKKTDEK